MLQTIGEGKFTSGCFGVACSRQWIAVSCYASVLLFDREGNYKRSPGMCSIAKGVAFAPSGELYVSEYLGGKIGVLAANLFDWRFICSEGSREGELKYPHYLALDPKENLMFVTEHGNQRVSVLTMDGKFVRSWGTPRDKLATEHVDGTFAAPRGVALLNGEVYVADCNGDNIQVRLNSRLLLLEI